VSSRRAAARRARCARDGLAAIDPLAGDRVVTGVHPDAQRVATPLDRPRFRFALSPPGMSLSYLHPKSRPGPRGGAGGVRTHDLTDYESPISLCWSRRHATLWRLISRSEALRAPIDWSSWTEPWTRPQRGPRMSARPRVHRVRMACSRWQNVCARQAPRRTPTTHGRRRRSPGRGAGTTTIAAAVAWFEPPWPGPTGMPLGIKSTGSRIGENGCRSLTGVQPAGE